MKAQPHSRRHFIKTGLIYVPTVFACRAGIVRLGNLNSEVGRQWIKTVTANGGSYTSSAIVIQNLAIQQIKSNGLRPQIRRLNFYCGIGLGAARTPVIVDRGPASDTLTNFVAGDFSEATGLTGDGTSKFNNTGLTTTDLVTDSLTQSFGLYVRTASNASALDMGVLNGVSTQYAYLSVSNTSSTYFSMGDNSAQIGPVGDSAGTGFYLGSRNGAAGKLYKNGTEIGTSANMGASVSGDATIVYVHATNNQGLGAFAWSARALGGYHIGRVFDATQQAVYRNIWQQLETSFARQV